MNDAESMVSDSFVAALEELTESLTKLKQEKYRLEAKVRQLGRLETIISEIRGVGNVYRHALVEISWAEDGAEARKIARTALNEPLRRLGIDPPQPPMDNRVTPENTTGADR